METNKKTTDEKFPGYPHYDAKDDITRNSEKIDGDVEEISALGKKVSSVKKDEPAAIIPESDIQNENDITPEDLLAIGTVDQDMDGGEDETLLPSIKMNDDIMGGDLDVPGSDDIDPDTDPEDEENNLFSRGQD